jgi:CPA2 family monovalent cation:H+ antiporter-2
LADLKCHVPKLEIATLRVDGSSPAAGKSLGEIDLRRQYGVHLLAIRRNGEILINPAGNERLCAEDALIILGQREQFDAVTDLFGRPQDR